MVPGRASGGSRCPPRAWWSARSCPRAATWASSHRRRPRGASGPPIGCWSGWKERWHERPDPSSRREFLRRTAEASGRVGASRLHSKRSRAREDWTRRQDTAPSSRGPTRTPVQTPLALPRGFRYWSIGAVGSTMSDGRPTPPYHDGTAAFAYGLSRAPGAQPRTARRRSGLRADRDGLRSRGSGRHHHARLRPRASGAARVVREPLRHQHELRGRPHPVGVLAHLRGDVPRNALQRVACSGTGTSSRSQAGRRARSRPRRCGPLAVSSTRRWRWTRRRASSTRPRMPRPPASSASCRRAVSRPADCRCWRVRER